jgi:hypothetical protein
MKLSTTFNILKWGVRFTAATAIAYGLTQLGSGIKNDFNQASHPEHGKELELVIQTPDGHRTYNDPDSITSALSNLPFKQSAQPLSAEQHLALYRQYSPLTHIMDRLIFSESGNDPDAVSHTGARGLGQFTGATFLEQLYRNKDKLPDSYDTITDNVIKYRKNQKQWEKDKRNVRPIWSYKVKDGYDKDRVMNLAHDPVVGEILSTEFVKNLVEQARDRGRLEGSLSTLISAMENSGKYNTPEGAARIDAMKEHLGRPLTSADIKTLYVFGLSGGIEALVAYADPVKANHRASDYTKSHVVKSNPDIFYYRDSNGNRHARSLAQLRDYFVERVGDIPVPKALNSTQLTQFISAQRAP